MLNYGAEDRTPRKSIERGKPYGSTVTQKNNMAFFVKRRPRREPPTYEVEKVREEPQPEAEEEVKDEGGFW